jgi:site-specific DNA-cytosine methylase
MRVLVACEESQRVCKAFRERGHNAFSCDIIPCSGGHPEWHIQGNVLKILNPSHHQLLMTGTPTGSPIEDCIVKEWRGISFFTMDGVYHKFEGKWDLIIAHPPCTYLTNTGNRWFDIERYGEKAIHRHKKRLEAAEFFMAIWNADCEKVVIENPIGYMSTYFRKPDQIIHPYYFAKSENDGNCERKGTCLWMRGVELLKYEIKYQPRIIQYKNGKGTDSPWHMKTMSLPKEERSRIRSQTFPGIADAMAEQWGNHPTEKGGGEECI